MKYRLVVFDWDGTIMDSTGLIADCIQRAAIDIDLPPPTLEQSKHIIGLGLIDSIGMLFPQLDEAGLQTFALRFRDHYLPRDADVLLYDGIVSVLENLAHDSRFLAVATGKPRRGLDRAFAKCGLQQHFHYTRCADEGFAKPHPDMLEKLMSFTGVGPEETLMIGDTTHDLDMAASAKCDALGVSYGAHHPEKLMKSPHRAIVPTVDALAAWLNKHA